MSITAEFQLLQARAKTEKAWLWPVLISVLVHILLIALANRKIDITTTAEEQPEKAIQSYLYVPPVEVKPEPVPEKASEAPELPEVQQQVDTKPPEAEVLQQDIVQPTQLEEIIRTEVNEQRNASTEAVEATPSTTEQQTQSTANRLLGQLQGLQQNQYQNMLQAQTQGYRQQWAQGVVRPSKAPVLTADQQLQKDTQITANCDKGINKTLAFLSGFTGGTIRCSANAEFKGFIKRRLNKEQQ